MASKISRPKATQQRPEDTLKKLNYSSGSWSIFGVKISDNVFSKTLLAEIISFIEVLCTERNKLEHMYRSAKNSRDTFAKLYSENGFK